ncbi:MAG: hypothetical protein KN64_03460 [Sulfurovum sp. AS07-7]|nr:MAG: hypothetical protein KN64_03460 [Sulfurovum sp. AS07-7]
MDVNDMVHIVQKGETLYGIAKIYKTTYQKLAERNEIAEPYTILEKQGLKVPIPRHTVKKEETLSSIAKIYGTTYQKLAQYNKISAPYSLKIGQVLNLIQVYDEAIEFLDINDEPISFVDYLLYLEHDIKVIGTTDDRGFTNKVNSNTLVKIINFDFLLKEPIMEDIEELI